jgi:hypothetical protein
MPLDGPIGYEERGGDLAIRPAFGDELCDAVLGRRQLSP